MTFHCVLAKGMFALDLNMNTKADKPNYDKTEC